MQNTAISGAKVLLMINQNTAIFAVVFPNGGANEATHINVWTEGNSLMTETILHDQKTGTIDFNHAVKLGTFTDANNIVFDFNAEEITILEISFYLRGETRTENAFFKRE